jgi:hypothetical protein
MRDLAIDADRTHLTEGETRSLEAWLAAFPTARQVLENFGVKK